MGLELIKPFLDGCDRSILKLEHSRPRIVGRSGVGRQRHVQQNLQVSAQPCGRYTHSLGQLTRPMGPCSKEFNDGATGRISQRAEDSVQRQRCLLLLHE